MQLNTSSSDPALRRLRWPHEGPPKDQGLVENAEKSNVHRDSRRASSLLLPPSSRKPLLRHTSRAVGTPWPTADACARTLAALQLSREQSEDHVTSEYS